MRQIQKAYRHRARRIVFTLLIFLLLPGSGQASAQSLMVIANSQFPKQSISLSYLKKIYLGKKRHEGRQKIVPFDYKDRNRIKARFIGKVMASTLGSYKSHWLKQQFREGYSPPAMMRDSDAMLREIKTRAGAIGYISQSEFKKDKNIKILLILD